MLTLDALAVRQSTPWHELMEAIERLLVDRNASVPQREIHDVGLPDGGTGSLLRGALVRPGTHIDLVGAFRADMREAATRLVHRRTASGAVGSPDAGASHS